MPADPKHVRDLFLAAADLPADERPAYLAEKCGGDAELRAAVERLLAAHDQPASVLHPVEQLLAGGVGGQRKQEPATGPLATEEHRGAGAAGTVVSGRYRLLERIGEGGMGEVWVAKQTKPVHRKVALKLIRADRDTRQVVARFEAERQALALMDHPNIAKVLDGGATETGRPFFVMELVNGLPLMQFCDEAKLTARQRLELFVAVCQAVQHAHQKGVIHRDLKPANILVTLYDGKPVPKIIDFGVAKAIGGRLTDESLSTQFGTVVGTLDYMAPEQAGFSAVDVDTRADVYSLGVILYELLTGLRPFDSKRLRKAALDELVHILREEEPPRPSTRLSTDESAPSLAALRQTDAKRLAALMRGELDWVVMRCLEKDRNRRYETADGLARDLQRYLADEPVEARPPSAGYKVRKFLKRNKGPALATALVLLALVGGIAGTTWGLVRAEGARRDAVKAWEAEARRADSEAKAKQEAKADRDRAVEAEADTRAFGQFVALHVLSGIRPGAAQGEVNFNLTLIEALQKAEPKIPEVFKGRPKAEAFTREGFGAVWHRFGKYAEAERHLRRAVQLWTAAYGPDAQETLSSKSGLAGALTHLGRYAEAEALFEEVLAVRKARLGADHPDTLAAGHFHAWVYQMQGDDARAEPLFREVFARARRALGFSHPTTQMTFRSLLDCYEKTGQPGKAEPLLRARAELVRQRDGPASPWYAGALAALGINLLRQGKHAHAEKALRDSLTIRGKHEPNAWTTFNTRSLLGEALLGQKKHAEAEEALLDGYLGMIARQAAIPPKFRPRLAEAIERLIRLYRETNKPEEVKRWQAEKAKLPPAPQKQAS
jgi:serine/threonine protein kinase/tetratricopeptide (TPR) repeat protein